VFMIERNIEDCEARRRRTIPQPEPTRPHPLLQQ
jgi:hypothetical protein